MITTVRPSVCLRQDETVPIQDKIYTYMHRNVDFLAADLGLILFFCKDSSDFLALY